MKPPFMKRVEPARWIAKTKPTNIRCLEGYAGVAEIYLWRWKMLKREIEAKKNTITTDKQYMRIQEAKANAKQACQALQGYSKVFYHRTSSRLAQARRL
jgi:hypothetical protein